MNKQMKISGLQLHIFRIIETSHYPPLKILKKDAEEADRIVAWLQREINEIWKRRLEIEPSKESGKRPVL